MKTTEALRPNWFLTFVPSEEARRAVRAYRPRPAPRWQALPEADAPAPLDVLEALPEAFSEVL